MELWHDSLGDLQRRGEAACQHGQLQGKVISLDSSSYIMQKLQNIYTDHCIMYQLKIILHPNEYNLKMICKLVNCLFWTFPFRNICSMRRTNICLSPSGPNWPTWLIAAWTMSQHSGRRSERLFVTSTVSLAQVCGFYTNTLTIVRIWLVKQK